MRPEGFSEKTKKTTKMVLIINDTIALFKPDEIETLLSHGDVYPDEKNNYLKFEIDVVGHFNEIIHHSAKYYDAVLVDYGEMDDGNIERNIDCLQKYYNEKTKLAWVSSMAIRNNSDARFDFPKNRFLHNLPFCRTWNENILYLLYGLFPKGGMGDLE